MKFDKVDGPSPSARCNGWWVGVGLFVFVAGEAEGEKASARLGESLLAREP